MLNDLAGAELHGQLERTLRRYAMDPTQANLAFRVISERYEYRRSTCITIVRALRADEDHVWDLFVHFVRGFDEPVARPPEREAATLPTILPQESDLVMLRELGHGGVGVVSLAEQRSLGREVAIKMPLSADPRQTASLVREALIMGSLEHPNFVLLHSLGVGEKGRAR